MLRQLSRQHQSHSCLDFSAGQGALAAVTHQTTGLTRHPVKYVVDEAIHNTHRVLGNASVRVHLLQHLVDVEGKGLCALLVGTLVPGSPHSLASASITLLYHYNCCERGIKSAGSTRVLGSDW